VNLSGALQYDDTSPLDDVTFNLQVGFVLPVFNKNQGNIYNAQSQIMENHQNLTAAQNELTAQLAEIYGRYSANRVLAQTYREEILPDQVRMHREGVQFRKGRGNLDLTPLIVSQQQLDQVVGEYVTVLQAQWQAVVDLAEVLQADELYSLDHAGPLPADPPRDAKPLLLPTPAKTAE
jgi:outer membrane protein TolC